MNAPFAEKLVGTEPETELEVSFRRTAERHGLRCLTLSYHDSEAMRWFSASVHRDYHLGHGSDDTLAEALAKALDDLNRKSALIGMSGELPETVL